MTAQPYPHPSRDADFGTGADRREAPRARGLLPALLVTPLGPVAVTVVEASLTGVRLNYPGTVLVPKQCRLQVPKIDLDIQVRRRWRKDALSGWRFLFTPVQEQAVRQRIAALTAEMTGF